VAEAGSSLWRSGDFLKFWAGQSVSLVGTQFTVLALPLAATLLLHASPLEMGVLNSLQFLPGLILGLWFGVLLDRSRRRPIMLAANLVSALAIGTVPAVWVLGRLTMAQMFVVVFLVGSSSMVLQIGEASYVPTLVGRDRLVDANSKLQASRTSATLIGPGLAGVAIQALGAPLAMAVDAVSYLAAVAGLRSIRKPEPQAVIPPGPGLTGQVRDGLRELWRQPLVRPIMLSLAVANCFSNLSAAVYFLLFAGQRAIPPGQLGLAFTLAGVSAIAGAQVMRLLVARVGSGRIMIGSLVLFGLGGLLQLTAAVSAAPLVLPFLLAGSSVRGFGLMAYNVVQQTVRQTAIPPAMLGRSQSGLLVAVWSAQALGALGGGLLGQRFGLVTAFAIGAGGALFALLPTLFSQLRVVRDISVRPAV
jgi:MFS family permease